MSSTRLSTPKPVNACAGMGGDGREDVGQPGLRIEPFIFAVYAAQRTMPKGAVHPRLQQFHRCTMPQHMRRHPLGLQ